MRSTLARSASNRQGFSAGINATRGNSPAPIEATRRVTTWIHLLGAPRIEVDREQVSGPRGSKAWALLAYLLLGSSPVPRERLAALLFGDADDPLGALRWNLAELRRALGPSLVIEGDPVVIHRAPETF